MVNIPPINVPTAIAAVLLSVLLSFLLRFVERRLVRSQEVKREKRRWYRRMAELTREIRFAITTRRKTLDFFKTRAIDFEEAFDDGADLEQLQKELREFGIEEPRTFIERTSERAASEYQEATQENIKSDMELYETRLREHLAKYPSDVDYKILGRASTILSRLNAISVTGQITREYEEDVDWKSIDVLLSSI